MVFLWDNQLIVAIFCIVDPCRWSDANVIQWLCWAIREFSLEGVNVPQFAMPGNKMCHMTREEFLSRAPPFMGDILWEHLEILRRGKCQG